MNARAFALYKSCAFIVLLSLLSLRCQNGQPRAEQAWSELQTLGQNLHDLRQQAGRFAKNPHDALSLQNYPDGALAESAIEKMRQRLTWLKPALITKQNQRYARLLNHQLQYEQQRQQDAQRHYQPLGKWPQPFVDNALMQRRYRRQLAAQGVVVEDPKPLYHQALLALGELNRRGQTKNEKSAALAAGTEKTKHAQAQVNSVADQNKAKQNPALASWQNDLLSVAQEQGWSLYKSLQKDINNDKNQALNMEKGAAFLAAVDVGIAVLALARERVVKMFQEQGALDEQAINAEIGKLRQQPGRAMATWLGLRAYRELAQLQMHVQTSPQLAPSYWIWVQQQGPLDLIAIKSLAKQGPQDPRASASQKPKTKPEPKPKTNPKAGTQAQTHPQKNEGARQ